MKVKSLVVYLLALILIGVFFSYKLLETPPGLTADEASLGYNGVLLAETLHDQNGRLLPFFILGNEGQDWHQPISQYFITTVFKLFGPSIFTLRLSSVLVVLISVTLIFLLAKKLIGLVGAILTTILFLTIPLLMIQSHLAMENIMVVPFSCLWLLAIYLHQQTDSKKYLVLAGLSLGLAFYSYKGMRATVPIWYLLTIIYLMKDWLGKLKLPDRKIIYQVVIFTLSLLPFLTVVPILQIKYPGAVVGGSQPALDSAYNFLYPYLSTFDPSFLFITGDVTIWHSTSKHGMFLLSSLPLLIIGLFQAIKKRNFWWFLIAAFFSAPLLYGLVGSVHRASRLMMMIPPYCLICGLGAVYLYQHLKNLKFKIITGLIILLLMVNYLDFVNFYWFSYPKFAQSSFGHISVYYSYENLYQKAQELKLIPYISKEIGQSEGEIGRFYEAIYFKELISKWSDNDKNPPAGSILLSARDDIPGLKKVAVKMPYYHLFVSP